MAKASKKTAKNSRKNKLGVKNSLVNNINARKKKGISRSAKKSSISDEAHEAMQNNWEKGQAKQQRVT
jgi:hypothetical protein